MPSGPDVPPRLLILIAVAVVLGGFVLLNPLGGDDESVTPATPPVTGEPQPPPEQPGAQAAEGDDAAIEAALERAFVTFDAAACGEVLTARALEQVTPGADDPLAECQEDAADDDNAKSIDVSGLEVNGSKASASVEPTGGDNAGAVYTLDLVDDAGWRIDRITSAQIVDREAFLDSQLKGIADDGALSREEGECVARFVRTRVPNSTLARTYVDGDISWIYEAMRSCIGDGTDAGVFSALVRRGLLSEQGLSASQADCVIRRLRNEFKSFTLDEAGDLGNDPQFSAAAQAAGAACVGSAGPQGDPADPASGSAGGNAGGEATDPQERYLDCVAAAATREEIRACADEVP